MSLAASRRRSLRLFLTALLALGVGSQSAIADQASALVPDMSALMGRRQAAFIADCRMDDQHRAMLVIALGDNKGNLQILQRSGTFIAGGSFELDDGKLTNTDFYGGASDQLAQIALAQRMLRQGGFSLVTASQFPPLLAHLPTVGCP